MSELAEIIRLSRDQTTFDLLLDEHTEACETLHRGMELRVRTSAQTWGLNKPATWTDDHKHLERLLGDYRDYCKRVAVVKAKVEARKEGLDWATVDWKHDYWHLAQWYLVCRRTSEPMWMLDKRGKPRLDSRGNKIQHVVNKQPQWRKVVRRGTKDHARVKGGLAWLEVAWERSVRPTLGREPRYVAWEKLLEPKQAA